MQQVDTQQLYSNILSYVSSLETNAHKNSIQILPVYETHLRISKM